MLAKGITGKGEGSRSFLHKLKDGCVMHDASYWIPYQLSGSQTSLLEILSAMR